MTINNILPSHFDAHRNVTQGQKQGSGPTLAELLGVIHKAPTLTPGTEAANVIAVAFDSGIESVEQYVAEVWSADTVVDATAFSVAETGVGAEVSPTGKGRLIFTTDVNGLAELSVTDEVGASGSTVYLHVRPLLSSGTSALQCAPVEVDLTFD